MWNTLTWQTLRNPEISGAIESLRQDTLRLILRIVLAGYLAWHLFQTATPHAASPLPYWTLFPIVTVGLGLTWALLSHKSRYAFWCFVCSSVASTTAAIWLLSAPMGTLFYPVIVLAAVVLLHPLAGLVVAAGSLAVLVGLWQAGPLALLGSDRLVEVGVASLLVTAMAWVLGRDTVIAVDWMLDSLAQALESSRSARAHRAELVQALKQLDTAYYRLERANAALELAWRAAETAERSKSEFVTNVSHELRTPLNLIAGFIEMMITSPESYRAELPSAYRSDLFVVYQNAQHLLTLTSDVIDLARVGIAHMALAREPVDLHEVVQDACELVRDYLTTKRLWLRTEMLCLSTENRATAIAEIRATPVSLLVLAPPGLALTRHR